MTTSYYTENLADIMACYTERKEVQNIITAWNEKGLPSDFEEENVRFAFNRNSGNVFLINDEHQVAMMNGDKLESFYSSPYEGYEGFIDDLIDMADDSWHEDDIDWLNAVKGNIGK